MSTTIHQSPSSGSMKNVLEEVLVGPYIGTFLECIETGYMLQLLSRYLARGNTRGEVAMVAAGVLISLLLLASHMFYVISAGCLGFASIDHVINLSWLIWPTVPISGIIVLIVHWFYVHRLIKLNDGKLWVKLFFGSLIISCFLINSSQWYLVSFMPKPKSVIDPEVAKLDKYFRKYYGWILALYFWNVVVDIVLCVATWISLSRATRKGIRTTREGLKKFMHISLQAMSLPTIMTLATAITHVVKYSGSLNSASYWSVNKLMLISLLHLLLARKTLSSRIQVRSDEEIDLRNLDNQPFGSLNSARKRCPSTLPDFVTPSVLDLKREESHVSAPQQGDRDYASVQV